MRGTNRTVVSRPSRTSNLLAAAARGAVGAAGVALCLLCVLGMNGGVVQAFQGGAFANTSSRDSSSRSSSSGSGRSSSSSSGSSGSSNSGFPSFAKPREAASVRPSLAATGSRSARRYRWSLEARRVPAVAADSGRRQQGEDGETHPQQRGWGSSTSRSSTGSTSSRRHRCRPSSALVSTVTSSSEMETESVDMDIDEAGILDYDPSLPSFRIWKAYGPLVGGPKFLKLHVSVVIEALQEDSMQAIVTKGMEVGATISGAAGGGRTRRRGEKEDAVFGQFMLFDFLPVHPLAAKTTRRLASLRSVPGKVRCRILRYRPRGLKLCGESFCSMDDFTAFIDSWDTHLRVPFNTCHTFADSFVEHGVEDF